MLNNHHEHHHLNFHSRPRRPHFPIRGHGLWLKSFALHQQLKLTSSVAQGTVDWHHHLRHLRGKTKTTINLLGYCSSYACDHLPLLMASISLISLTKTSWLVIILAAWSSISRPACSMANTSGATNWLFSTLKFGKSDWKNIDNGDVSGIKRDDDGIVGLS